MKNHVLSLVAKASEKSAKKGSGFASLFLLYQPKEPKCVRK
ncbi:MAG: cyclic lactone autoinducer peptide [Clostridiales bacterium]|nr:cyclic lactone autoinducer peptide [Clostridiales bacterium]